MGVSESTVVRFATEIGYSGYPALQQAMQEMIRSKMTSVQRLERTSRNIPADRLLDEVLDQDIEHSRAHQGELGPGGLLQNGRRPGGGEKGVCAGAGSSLALATFLAHYLRLVFDTVHLVEATSEATILQQMVRVERGTRLSPSVSPATPKRP